MNIAFLVFKKFFCDSNRKNKSFDGQSNIGAYIIKDVLERNGYKVDFCSPETACKFNIVLISLTSSYDVLNLLKSVIPLSKWKNRKFKVIIGGAGVQNITALREYIDYAVFGRGENIICDLIYKIKKGKEFIHKSVINFSMGITNVKMSQAMKLYPHEIDIYPKKYKEKVIGCNKKCLFCHYSFAREILYLNSNIYDFPIEYMEQAKEMLFVDLLKSNIAKKKIRTAIDGQSERLRNCFNKRISNELIKRTIETISLQNKNNKIWLYIYTIGGYPTEAECDREEIKEVLNSCNLKGGKVFINFHVSRFRPSPLTPSAYLPIDFSFDWKTCNYKIVEKENLIATFDYSRESLFHYFCQLFVERATAETDDIIKTILFSKKLNKMKVKQKFRAIINKFDITQYVREYSTEEKLPTWYLESYIPNEKIKKMANILKKRLGLKKSTQGF